MEARDVPSPVYDATVGAIDLARARDVDAYAIGVDHVVDREPNCGEARGIDRHLLDAIGTAPSHAVHTGCLDRPGTLVVGFEANHASGGRHERDGRTRRRGQDHGRHAH
jgi:hypothetical protein